MDSITARRPNVVFFFTDQQRYDTLGLAGNPLDLTPNLDRLAGSGTFWRNCVTMQPVCGPARSCLQSGRYATATGCWRNDIPLPATEARLAPAFNAAGYKTAYVGKWHLSSAGKGATPVEQRGGYQYWLASNILELVSDAYDTHLFDNQGRDNHLPGYRVDAMTDAAIRFIGDHRHQSPEQPFFLFLSFLEPHHQNSRDDYPAPHGYEERYAGRWTPPDLAALGGSSGGHLPGYLGMIKRLDEALGRLQDALVSLGLDQNTIVVFTSDHGCHFKTRNSEYKRSCHEASIHVPCALWGPGFEGGAQKDEVISLLDLPPTLLEASGIPVPAAMQGHSLMPLVWGEEKAWPNEAFIQISEAETGRALRTERWKYALTAPLEFISGGSSTVYREAHLYDLEADPHELNNLIGHTSHRRLADHLRERLLERMVAAGEDRPQVQTAPEIAVQGPVVSHSESIC